MPELPECEASRKAVEAGALNRTIEGFEEHNTIHLELPGPQDRDRLKGHQFTETHRHGKHIFAGSKSGPWIAVHLGMTGSLKTFDAPRDLPDYAHFIIRFEGDRRLIYYNPRKFGWMRVIDDPHDWIANKDLGPDAMEIGDNMFADRIGGSRGTVKSALLDQKKLAGVGNLWADEALYRAGIGPEVKGTELGSDRIATLYKEMRASLQGVLDVNADYGKLPGDWLIHNREEGADCPRCGGTITKKTVGGRTAYFCPDYQEAA
ncbi:Fpg/Nei family DNA glycosylase [Aestuariibius sp. 2305UL40-4]|uniref:Fpg/Nei family DNA glycosylase n=1 Tax=Aestuariibius violaceus TaxID=3234132 RepID=UPI00345EB8B5